MRKKIGKNDPCPCGSGKKYKKCCMNNPSTVSGHDNRSARFRFEPGSYGDIENFTPSIACLKEIAPDQWGHHFVLVNLNQIYAEETGASSKAEDDLEAAFLNREKAGSHYAVAEHLKSKGYLSVKNFNIVKT